MSSQELPSLSQDQKDRITRNREAALQRQRKRVEDAELEFLIENEAQIREEEKEARLRNSFDGFAHNADSDGPPKSKKAKIYHDAKESQLFTDMQNVVNEGSVVRIQGTKVIDTGGGFLIEEGDLVEQEEQEKVLSVHPAAFVPTDAPNCQDCGLSFSESYLLLNFDHPVCDRCK